MNELERLYRHLVSTVNAAGTARWQDPIMLADLLALIPYRTGRRALGIDSSEEYELLILRLAGGEGNFMSTEPEAVGQRFANEAVSVNPNLSVLREFRDARLMFIPGALMRVLQGPKEEEMWAPPEEADRRSGGQAQEADRRSGGRAGGADDVTPPDSRPAGHQNVGASGHQGVGASGRPGIDACPHCRRVLPTGRTIKFCPYCGGSQTRGICPACTEEVELSWKHCVNCGAALTQGTR